MLFWTFIIITVVFGLVAALIISTCDWGDFSEFVFGINFAISGLGAIAVIMSLLIMMFSYIGNDGYVARQKQQYDALVYQYENDFYENDNDIGKRELMDDIQSWNEWLAESKINQRDFWIGIYIPNIYDQFEFISLEKGK